MIEQLFSVIPSAIYLVVSMICFTIIGYLGHNLKMYWLLWPEAMFVAMATHYGLVIASAPIVFWLERDTVIWFIRVATLFEALLLVCTVIAFARNYAEIKLSASG